MATAAPPNVVFIHMEDMGTEIPAYGVNVAATPNLDRLAAEGVVFERAHVTAATCAASRGSLFTGLYPHQNGIMGFVKEHGFHYRDGVPNFVRDLKTAGYVTGLTYKDGVESKHYGKQHPVPFDFRPKYTENWLTGQTGKKAPASKEQPPLASFAVDNFRYFLENLEANKPFYFQAQTPDTHHVWNRSHFIRKGEPAWPYPAIDKSRINETPGWGDALVPKGGLLKSIGEYYDAIQRTDWYVGRILALLEEYGHADNTLVVFSADHGPSHLLRGKKTPGEFGLRVPFIVRWPGKAKAGTRSNALVSFVDLYPTFVDAAGLAIPDHLPGYSLVPVLEGKSSSRKHLYSAFVAHTTGMHQYWPSRTITDGRWKLIHHLRGNGKRERYHDGNHALHSLNAQLQNMQPDSLARQLQARCEAPPTYELYDLKNDPHEHANLFGDEKVADIQSRLLARLQDWRRDVSDPFLDEAYRASFTEAYVKNCKQWETRTPKAKGGEKDKTALDFAAFIPPWDASPYLNKRDR
jgi:N-sulfoglucosamine sulfohydrolase